MFNYEKIEHKSALHTIASRTSHTLLPCTCVCGFRGMQVTADSSLTAVYSGLIRIVQAKWNRLRWWSWAPRQSAGWPSWFWSVARHTSPGPAWSEGCGCSLSEPLLSGGPDLRMTPEPTEKQWQRFKKPFKWTHKIISMSDSRFLYIVIICWGLLCVLTAQTAGCKTGLI